MVLAIVIAVLFVGSSHCYTEAFFAQRAHLEIGRALNCDLKRIIRLEWLESYRGALACQYFRWIILVVAYYFYGWKMPVSFYVMEQLYMTFRPIPDRSYREVMNWFRVVVEQDESLARLYDTAQVFLRAKGVAI